MKKIITAAACWLYCNTVFSQQLLNVKDGASVVIQPGAYMAIQGSVLLENGSVLVNNGSIEVSDNGIASWIDNTIAAYSYGTGSLLLSNKVKSIISSQNTFARIDVNTPLVILQSDISAGKWYLINGVITTGIYKSIASNAAQTAVEAAAANPGFSNCWFNGNLRRYINPSLVNEYAFPLGNTLHSNAFLLTNLLANPLTGINYLDASTGPKPGTDAGLAVYESGTPYIAVNNGGVWYLNPDAIPASGKFDLQLFFTGFTGLSDNSFAILQRPSASSNAAAWIVPAGSSLPGPGLPGRTLLKGYAQRNALASFGQFGIGVAANALQVTLVDFAVTRLSAAKVQLSWQTTMEQNNKGFETERRLDNENAFSAVNFLPALSVNGNSSTPLNYMFIDANDYPGVSYYRLKQIDLDNNGSYSAIKAVKGMGNANGAVQLWPNPNKGRFNIKITGTDRKFRATVTDIAGKIIQQINIQANTTIAITGLSAGTYVLFVQDAFGQGQSFREKVLVLKP